MESNRSSVAPPAGLEPLKTAVDRLAVQDLTRLTDAAAAERVLALRRLLDRLEGQWLRELAAVDGRGAAGAEQGVAAPSTAAWLRGRLRAGGATASGWVRTARALFRGPLGGTAHALADGELSVAHAAALAQSTHHLPATPTAAAEPVLLDTARRLDPPTLRRSSGTWSRSPTPIPPTNRRNADLSGAGCGCRRPSRGWWRSMGCWTPKPARPC
jgi:hypothetical protein